MQNMKIVIFVALALAVGSCAFVPQQANLEPNVSLSSSNIGVGTKVYIDVRDERVSKSLGRRGNVYGGAAEITSKQNLSEVVRREIENGLNAKGFVISDAALAVSTLVVEIRSLEYSTSQGFFTGGVHIKGAFKGVARNKNSEFDKIYRYEKEERVLIVPTAETNELWINQALSETLNKLLNDDELLEFLSTR